MHLNRAEWSFVQLHRAAVSMIEPARIHKQARFICLLNFSLSLSLALSLSLSLSLSRSRSRTPSHAHTHRHTHTIPQPFASTRPPPPPPPTPMHTPTRTPAHAHKHKHAHKDRQTPLMRLVTDTFRLHLPSVAVINPDLRVVICICQLCFLAAMGTLKQDHTQTTHSQQSLSVFSLQCLRYNRAPRCWHAAVHVLEAEFLRFHLCPCVVGGP